MKSSFFRRISLGILCAVPLFSTAGPTTAAESLKKGVFAEVNGTVVSQDEYLLFFRNQARQKYYHGGVPATELEPFQREVANQLLRRVLLAKEAERRRISPDKKWVDKQLDRMEQKLRADPEWSGQMKRILDEARQYLMVESRVARLEEKVRAVAPPAESQLRAYYEQNPDKFTTPERVRLSLILRAVPPSALPEEWSRAQGEIQELATQLKGGADFAEVARLHSQHDSAKQGGVLDFLHRDMLADTAQSAIDTLQEGETTEPLLLLEGYAMFRLIKREPARLNPLSVVRDRAKALWLRDAQDQAWVALGDKLQREATIRINEDFLTARNPETPPSQTTPRAGDAP